MELISREKPFSECSEYRAMTQESAGGDSCCSAYAARLGGLASLVKINHTLIERRMHNRWQQQLRPSIGYTSDCYTSLDRLVGHIGNDSAVETRRLRPTPHDQIPHAGIYR